MAASDPIGYVTLSDPGFRNGNNAAGWAINPIFPGYTDAADLPTRIATIRSGLLNYLTIDAIPNARATSCRGFNVHEGWNGSLFPGPVTFNGDPGVFRPEMPQSTVQEAIDLLIANGLDPWTTIRPTEWDGSGVVQGNYGQPYGPDPVATVRRKLGVWYAMGGRGVYHDSSHKDLLDFFTAAEVQGWLDEFPGLDMMMEWWRPAYGDKPRVRALHQPNPGGYLREGGMQETPDWDYRGNYWLDAEAGAFFDDPNDPADVARLSAAYARGAQLYLYVGSGAGNPTWATQHAVLWRAHYPGATGAGGGTTMSTLNGSSTLAAVQAAYDDNASYAEDESVTKCRAFLTACRILLRRMPAQTGTREAQLQLSPALIQKEMTEARSWLDANDTGPSSRRGPSTSVASFREFRDC